jgi:uncharacterized protein YkwD
MRPLAVLAVALAAAHATVAAATPPLSIRVERRAALEAAVVRELNRVRGARGLPPLHVAPSLRTAARTHTQEMLELGFFGHDSPNGTAFSDRIRRYYSNRGWETWTVGEALAASRGETVEARTIVTAWLASASHRKVILSPEWRDAGVGALYAPTAPHEYGGDEALVVTADFGLRAGRAVTS